MPAWAAALLWSFAATWSAVAAAQSPEELRLLSEHPVAGMRGGNLSGLAVCDGALWTLSDRDDDRLYRLDTQAALWQAVPERFKAPPAPDSGLPWGLRVQARLLGPIRGGVLDFEGLSCDAQGNRYLVSEAQAAVLQLPASGDPVWLALPSELVRQARNRGMLLRGNALFEGIAVDPAGQTLWLAAERERRGLLIVSQRGGRWRCSSDCILRVGGGTRLAPAALGNLSSAQDYSDLSLYEGHLFTLERQAHRICRRDAQSGKNQRCWSFANAALTPARRYSIPFGMAEALVVDAEGAWIGVDNGGRTRQDGEERPIIWRFAAPLAGWNAP